jgi:hypothetical protein
LMASWTFLQCSHHHVCNWYIECFKEISSRHFLIDEPKHLG